MRGALRVTCAMPWQRVTSQQRPRLMFDYLQMESLTPYLKQLIAESAMPLQSIERDFAVDSSGFQLRAKSMYELGIDAAFTQAA